MYCWLSHYQNNDLHGDLYGDLFNFSLGKTWRTIPICYHKWIMISMYQYGQWPTLIK